MMLERSVEHNQKLPIVAVEVEWEHITPRAFLKALYQEIDAYCQDRGMEPIFRASKQHVDDWESSEGRFWGFDLQEGVIYRAGDLDLGLAIGAGGRHTRGDFRPLRVMFGGFFNHPVLRRERKPLDMNSLAFLIDERKHICCLGGIPGHCVYGEFREDDREGVNIDCWADRHGITGSRLINSWPQGRILSSEGKQACLEIVDRTIRQSR